MIPTHATDSGPECRNVVVVDEEQRQCLSTVYGYAVTDHRNGNVVATCQGCTHRLQWADPKLDADSHVLDVRKAHEATHRLAFPHLYRSTPS